MKKLALTALLAAIAFLASATLPSQSQVSASSVYDLRCFDMNPDQDGIAPDQGAIKCSLKINVFNTIYNLLLYVDWNDVNGDGRSTFGDVKTKYYANLDYLTPTWYWDQPPPTMTRHTGVYWNGCVLACPFVAIPWYGDASWYAIYPMSINDATTIQIDKLLHGVAVWCAECVLFEWIWAVSTDYYVDGAFIRTLRGDAPANVIVEPDYTPLYAWSYINKTGIRPHGIHHVTVSADPISFNIHDWYDHWYHRVP